MKTGSAGSTEWVETSVIQNTEDGLWAALHDDRNPKHTTEATTEWLKTSVLWKEDEVAGGQPRNLKDSKSSWKEGNQNPS